MTDQQVLLAVLALAGVIASAIIGARQKSTADLLGALRDEVERQGERIDVLERRDRVQADYINKLRSHISDGKPPPPPPFPDELR